MAREDLSEEVTQAETCANRKQNISAPGNELGSVGKGRKRSSVETQ